MYLVTSEQWQDVMIDINRGKISSFPSSLSANNCIKRFSWHPYIYCIVRTNVSDFTAKWQCAPSKNRFHNQTSLSPKCRSNTKTNLVFLFTSQAVTWDWSSVCQVYTLLNSTMLVILYIYITRCLMDMYTTSMAQCGICWSLYKWFLHKNFRKVRIAQRHRWRSWVSFLTTLLSLSDVIDWMYSTKAKSALLCWVSSERSQDSVIGGSA